MTLSGFKIVVAPAQRVLRTRLALPRAELPGRLGEALSEVMHLASARGAGPGPTFVRRLFATEARVEVEAGVCVSEDVDGAGEFQPGSLPDGKLACAVWTGDFDSLEEGHRALLAEAAREGLEAVGAPWEVALTGPSDVSRPDLARAQLYLPVR